MVNSDLTVSASCDPKDLVGTWTVVSVVAERDGRKFDSYGANAKGMLVLDANGRYSMIFIAGGLPRVGYSVQRNRGRGQGGCSWQPGPFRHLRRRRGGQELNASDRPRDTSKLGRQEQQALVCYQG
jgi:hypothetical protein